VCDFLASNCWDCAQGKAISNCARDKDIEYITSLFFDIDVVSDYTQSGHPASDEELKLSLNAAQLLSRENRLALSCTICCSGRGHYVLVPIVPMPVDGDEVGLKFRGFCEQLAARISSQVNGAKLDPVYNLSRVMRVIGALNRKGQAIPGRPHSRAHFVTEPLLARSMALHYMILNTEVERPDNTVERLPKNIRCDLRKLEKCEFIQWCRKYPEDVSEPSWWGLIANLAHLEGGIQLIHEISRLDRSRYDYSDTQRIIQRVIDAGYKPVSCRTLVNSAMSCLGRGRFTCSTINQCPAKAPMYMATLHTVYKR